MMHKASSLMLRCALAIIACAINCGATRALTVTLPDVGISFEMKSNPEQARNQDADGELRTWLYAEGDSAWMVSYHVTNTGDFTYESTVEALTQGKKVLNSRWILDSEQVGREVIWDAGSGQVIRKRIFIPDGKHAYAISYAGTGGTETQPEVEAFMTSLNWSRPPPRPVPVLIEDVKHDFSIEFPDKPEFTRNRKDKIKPDVYADTSNWETGDKLEPRVWWVNVTNVDPKRFTYTHESVVRNFLEKRDSVLVNKVTGSDAREVSYVSEDKTVRLRIFVPRADRMITVGYVGPTGSEKFSDVESFMNSFRLGIAGAPASPRKSSAREGALGDGSKLPRFSKLVLKDLDIVWNGKRSGDKTEVTIFKSGNDPESLELPFVVRVCVHQNVRLPHQVMRLRNGLAHEDTFECDGAGGGTGNRPAGITQRGRYTTRLAFDGSKAEVAVNLQGTARTTTAIHVDARDRRPGLETEGAFTLSAKFGILFAGNGCKLTSASWRVDDVTRFADKSISRDVTSFVLSPKSSCEMQP